MAKKDRTLVIIKNPKVWGLRFPGDNHIRKIYPMSKIDLERFCHAMQRRGLEILFIQPTRDE